MGGLDSLGSLWRTVLELPLGNCQRFVVMVSLVSIVGVVRMVSKVEMVSKVGWQTARGVSTNLWKSLCLILKAALIFFF